MRSVLVADDNPDDLALARRILEKSSRVASITTVSDPLDGLERARREPPALLLLDINMPVMTGFELLEALEASNALDERAHVVMLSSSSAEADKEAAARFASVRDYLVKPLSRRVLEELADRFGEPPHADPAG